MAVRDQVSLDDVIDFLNIVLELDCSALIALIANRVPCNESLAMHPTVQVGTEDDAYQVGMLGLLNGLFGIIDSGKYWGFGPIVAIFEADEDGTEYKRLVRFRRTNRRQPNDLDLEP